LRTLTGSYSRIAALAAIVFCTATSGCLESVDPTPTSEIVTIVPLTASTGGTERETETFFAIEVRIRNKSSRTIYFDRAYARTEKLIDQKWEMARETTAPPFSNVRTIGPSQSLNAAFEVRYRRDEVPASIHLEHIRGLYRLRLRFSYTSNGSDPIPAEESYSRPFVVQ